MARGKGQPRVGEEFVLDLVQLEKLASYQASIREAAAWLDVDEKTLRVRLKQPEVAKVWEHGRCKGRIALREMQLDAAKGGDRTMLVWLGKNMLDQTDVSRLDMRLLHQSIESLIDAYQSIAKGYVPEDKWEEFCGALRRHADASLET